MWLLERCRKEWKDAPSDINVLNAEACKETSFRSFINPDDPRFTTPKSMIKAIQDYCKESGQPVPENYRQIARCIFDSLAMRYREVLDYLKDFAPFPIEKLHVIGGGTYNTHLMQMTANSTGLTVITGPVEGTAIGNIMLQAKAAGLVSDRFEMRQIISNSIETRKYEPQERDVWDKGYKNYLRCKI